MDVTTYRFDQSTTPRYDADLATIELDGDWNVNGTILNGGYLKAVAVAAARNILAGHQDPVAVSTTFVAPPIAGAAQVRVSALRRGRSITSGVATMTQNGEVVLQSLITLGAVADQPVAAPHLPMPDVPAPEDCLARGGNTMPPNAPGLGNVLEMALVPDFDGWLKGQPLGEPRQRAWVRFRDGRPLDTLGLVALCDMLPPVCFAQGNFGWAPTLQLQVGIFAQPTGQWLLVDLLGSPYDGVFGCEDAEMWDQSGQLVARSRQVAMLPKAT